MLLEILKELVLVYRRWHEKNRYASALLLLVIGLIAVKFLWAFVVLLTSFGGLGAERHGVSGFVTWQGKPLDVGVISFRPLEQQPFDSGAMIDRGAFTVPVDKGLFPGKYRVMIHSSVADPSFPAPSPGERDTRPGIEILPSLPHHPANETHAPGSRYCRESSTLQVN
jgi:hypothetical protein